MNMLPLPKKPFVGDVKKWIDTGSYALNALLSGSIFKGFPANKIVGYIGLESTGKTFFVLSTCKNFLDENANNSVFYFETENALTTEILEGRKIDLNRFAIMPVSTVQEFKTQALRIADYIVKYKKKDKINPLFVLDSLGNLSTSKEMEDSESGAETKDMTRAQSLKATFRVITLKLGMGNIPMLLTNHVYAKIGAGPYAGNEQSGGSGSKYASSITVNLTKAKEKDGDEHIGSVITCTIVKSRLTKEGLKVKALIKFNGRIRQILWVIRPC
jgi:RecA/RadA recombinase